MKKLTLILLGLMLMPFLWLTSSCSDDNDPIADDSPVCVFGLYEFSNVEGSVKILQLTDKANPCWYFEPSDSRNDSLIVFGEVEALKNDEIVSTWVDGMTVVIDSLTARFPNKESYKGKKYLVFSAVAPFRMTILPNKK